MGIVVELMGLIGLIGPIRPIGYLYVSFQKTLEGKPVGL